MPVNFDSDTEPEEQEETAEAEKDGRAGSSRGDKARTTIPKAAPKRDLKASIAYLEKLYGSGTVMDFNAGVIKAPAISTSHPFIDYVTGIGGFPRGKITELYGMESSGKTTLMLHAIAQDQRAGGAAIYIDLEQSFDGQYARNLGVDLKKLYVSQPFCAEEAFEIAREFMDCRHVTMVIIDSVAALIPKAELDPEATVGKAQIGSQSMIVSQAIKQLAGRANAYGIALIFINQVRNVIPKPGQRPSQTTPGGNALKFYASLRLELTKIASIKGKLRDPFTRKEYDGVVGIRVRVKGAKNKCAVPFRQCEVSTRFGEGFDVQASIIEVAVAQGTISKGSTGWYELGPLGFGRVRGDAALRQEMAQNPEIVKRILERLDLGAVATAPTVVSVEMNVDSSNFGDSPEMNALLGVTPELQEPESDHFTQKPELVAEARVLVDDPNWEGIDDDIELPKEPGVEEVPPEVAPEPS